MDIVEIEAQSRDARGSRACRRLRKEGLVPAVLYGHREPNVLLSLHRSELERLLEMRTFILQVKWDGRRESHFHPAGEVGRPKGKRAGEGPPVRSPR
ncbi:MAG: hypothetical protein ACYS8L_09545 [Planctomycetota bacterium]|jgi:large subunit ribosomal protein L25